MIDFQLAPFIIAGLLIMTGYVSARWAIVAGELRQWKMQARAFEALVIGMREEGCAALGALENIFNGVTAGGMPHSKLVQKIAGVATDALAMTPSCGHKVEVERLGEDVVAAQAEVEYLAGELMVARLSQESLWHTANNAMRRMEEAERLLGLANDKLIVERSQRADSTPPLPYERGDVPEADD